jgi:hypothetical protein
MCTFYMRMHMCTALDQSLVCMYMYILLKGQICVLAVHIYILNQMYHRLERTAFLPGDCRVLQKVPGGIGEGVVPTAFYKI